MKDSEVMKMGLFDFLKGTEKGEYTGCNWACYFPDMKVTGRSGRMRRAH
jgi:hypothetical protein